MTPEQALAILDQVTSRVPLTRDDHAKVVEALKIFQKLMHPVLSEVKKDANIV